MDACETCFVQNGVAPREIVRWLHAFVRELAPPVRGGFWELGPRDLGQSNGAAHVYEPMVYEPMVYEPTVYETVAIYAMPPHDPFSPGKVAFSLTFMPLNQRCFILELRRWSPLPVALETVVGHLTAYFSESPTTVSGAAPLRSVRGAPPLACNSWLELQLASLPPHTGLRPLYTHWIEQHRAVRGDYPVEPLRSFRAAVAGCRARIARRRSKRTR
jgi:hypothetical protein